MGSTYDISSANIVPDKKSVSFGATAKDLQCVIAYIDIRDSRSLLTKHKRLLTARAHKSFLHVAAKCVVDQSGDLRSFSGDSVIALFKGENAEKRAVKAAMKTKYAVYKIINPFLQKKANKILNFGVGIARGDILVVKSGVPGNEMYQDLIWIGWPTYHAFEYGNAARAPRNIWISSSVHNAIKDDRIMTHSDGQNMWVYEDRNSATFGKHRVFKTSYHWEIK